MRWDELVEGYLGELAGLGRRPHTVRGYRSDLAHLLTHLPAEVGATGEAALAGYLTALARMAPATRGRHRSAATGFLRWSAAREPMAADLFAALAGAGRTSPMPGGTSEATRVAPPASDVHAALAAIPRQADRDQLLFGMLARLGLRPGEALALRLEDFDEPGQCVHVPGWGGARRRVLVDDPDVLMRLVNWTHAAGGREGPMFRAAGRTTPLRYQSVAARWARYQEAAGVVVRLGDLRRSHAAELLAGGVPEWVVRQRLGQRSGPLPWPGATDGDDAIRVWRARSDAHGSPTGRRSRHAGRSGRAAG